MDIEERRNRQDIKLTEVFKMYRRYSYVALQELFEMDTNSKGIQEGTLVNLKRSGAQEILRGIFFEQSY